MNLTPKSRTLPSGIDVHYWERDAIFSLWGDRKSLKMVADCCRLNAVTAIQVAGSGHIGTSLSSLDIMIAVRRFLAGHTFLDGANPERTFFSSKGHDAPAFYAMMHACGQLTDEDLFTLRRLGGLPGHPETITPGVPTNTGSLGMGISKAKGFTKAQRLNNPDSRDPVVVMLGDGELNEGQIWESMPGAVRDGFSELIAIVDANQIQSDTWTNSTLPMGDMRKRVEGVGWAYLECDGNNPDEVLEALEHSRKFNQPTLILADTLKGSGIAWMEEFPAKGEYYKFHSGALAPEVYATAARILIGKVTGVSGHASEVELPTERPELDSFTPRARPESMLTLWEKMLMEVMTDNPQVVALDGDLSYDTGTHLARHLFPDRYIQAGIAEQDMVSTAGTLALSGYLPIVHSFATFLTMRATEQIFNNATEYSRIIYLGFLAGLVPSAPGFSHQAVTDVGIMSSIPGMRVFEPSCAMELRWALSQAQIHPGPSYIRMGGLSPTDEAQDGAVADSMVVRAPGEKVAFVSSGPLLTNAALEARDALMETKGFHSAVYTIPEITGSGLDLAVSVLSDYELIVVLENYNPALGKYTLLEKALAAAGRSKVIRLGLEGIPANGQPAEVLAHHGLDVPSIVSAVAASL